MTDEEALMLTRYVKACCPQQAMDKYTPDAWYELLDDLELADCRAAAKAVAKRQPFVAPAEIRAEVRKIRDERAARSVIQLPTALADDQASYREALAEGRKRAGDGVLPARPALRAIEGGAGHPEPERRQRREPESMRTAIAEIRKVLGPGRARGRGFDPQKLAARQAEEARREREGGESA